MFLVWRTDHVPNGFSLITGYAGLVWLIKLSICSAELSVIRVVWGA